MTEPDYKAMWEDFREELRHQRRLGYCLDGPLLSHFEEKMDKLEQQHTPARAEGAEEEGCSGFR